MKVVRAQGTPYERGAVIGEAFADAMTSSLAFNRRYLTGHGVSGDALERLLDPYLAAANAALPHLVSQIRGMADGAGMPFLDVFAANAFEEVYGVIELSTPSPVPLERCTDVVLRSSQSTLLGHNEQWYAGDDGAVGLVLDVSDDAPSVLAPVVAGTLAPGRAQRARRRLWHDVLDGRRRAHRDPACPCRPGDSRGRQLPGRVHARES